MPALEDATPEGVAQAHPPATTTTSAEMTGPVASDTAMPAPRQATWQKPAALVAGGVGVAGLALGTVFVLRAKSKYDDSLAQCPASSNLCTPQGVSLRDDARTAGNIATVAYAAGAVSLGAGLVLWLTAPKAEAPRTSAEVHLSPTAGGAMIYGRW